MTRLKEGDLEPIEGHLVGYDSRLKRLTGASLRQIAFRAAGIDEPLIEDILDGVSIAAVPVTSGLGVIGGFSATVAAIVSHLGFEAFVSESCDDAGMAEGIERGADILMFADDSSFVAVTPERQLLADNSPATAEGFVAALELMKGGLAGESALVLGCGPVGLAAARALLDRGAWVALRDLQEERAQAALRELGEGAPGRVRIASTSPALFQGYELIFAATNEGGFIEAAHLTPGTLVAAPGMPCALTPEAMEEHGDRVLHDPLEMGTATMAVQAAAILARGEGTGKVAEG